MIKNVAFFDLDGTLIPHTSSERMFVKHLIQSGVLTLTDIVHFVRGALYNVKGGWQGISKRNKFYLKGKNVKYIEGIAKEFVKKYIDSIISVGARNIIEKHKANGDVLIMVSGSPYFIVKVFAQMLGFNDYKGTDLIMSNKKFTGKINGIHPFGKTKVDIIQYFLTKYALNIKYSTVYANHFVDRYMMSLSPKPVAVNPSWTLKKYCKKKGWEILYV